MCFTNNFVFVIVPQNIICYTLVPLGIPLNSESTEVQRQQMAAACQPRHADQGTCRDGARCRHLTPVPPVPPPYKHLLCSLTLCPLNSI